MKHLLPGRNEIFVLVALAMVCTLVVAITRQYGLCLALLGGGLFLISALMGLNRSIQLRRAQAPVAESNLRVD